MIKFWFILITLFVSTAFAGSIPLSWDAPTTNNEGTCGVPVGTTPVVNFSGKYEVVCGLTSGVWTITRSLTDTALVVNYLVTGLTDNTNYYCIVTAVNNSGGKSCPSNIVMKKSSGSVPGTLQLTMNEIIISPYMFQNVRVLRSAYKMFTLRNTTKSLITYNILIIGDSDFTTVPSISVRANNSAQFAVAFKPKVKGYHAAILRISTGLTYADTMLNGNAI